MDFNRPYPKTHEDVDAADHLLMQCRKLGKTYEECAITLIACGHDNPGIEALTLRYLSLKTILCKQFTVTDEYHLHVGAQRNKLADGTVNWDAVSEFIHQHSDIGNWSIEELKAKHQTMAQTMDWPTS